MKIPNFRRFKFAIEHPWSDSELAEFEKAFREHYLEICNFCEVRLQCLVSEPDVLFCIDATIKWQGGEGIRIKLK